MNHRGQRRQNKEFIKAVKRSEYSVAVTDFYPVSSTIIRNSRGCSFKSLDESHLAERIARKDLEIVCTNTITFTEDELTTKENRAWSLHIVVECRGIIISRVLSENESTHLSCYDLKKNRD